MPKLTHLQFLVVVEILGGATRGRLLRDRLKEAGVRQSGPAFYQMMAVLEDAGFISGWYEQQVIDSQIIRERHYRVLASGKKAAEESRDFYRVVGRRGLGLASGG
jgi:DNA-binding PadR family transcriptional regulator